MGKLAETVAAIAVTTVWVNTTSVLSASRQGPCRSVILKNALLVGRLGSGTRLVRSVRARTPPRVSDRVRTTPCESVRVRSMG